MDTCRAWLSPPWDSDAPRRAVIRVGVFNAQHAGSTRFGALGLFADSELAR